MRLDDLIVDACRCFGRSFTNDIGGPAWVVFGLVVCEVLCLWGACRG